MKKEREEGVDSVPKSPDGQSRRQSVTFDLSNIPNSADKSRKKHLWKLAGSKALTPENEIDELKSKNGLGQRTSLLKGKVNCNRKIPKVINQTDTQMDTRQ